MTNINPGYRLVKGHFITLEERLDKIIPFVNPYAPAEIGDWRSGWLLLLALLLCYSFVKRRFFLAEPFVKAHPTRLFSLPCLRRRCLCLLLGLPGLMGLMGTTPGGC